MITCTQPFWTAFNLTVPLVTQKAWIFFDCKVLHFFKVISDIYKAVIKVNLTSYSKTFFFFCFFVFFLRIVFLHIFSFQKLNIAFLEALLVFIQWQSSIFGGSTIISNFSKTCNTVFKRTLASVESGIPVSSRHFQLEYWLLL